jgi:phosphatidate cytidylyltransferase
VATWPKRFGRRHIAPSISPNKTAEGLLAGMAASVVIGFILVGSISPWGRFDALALGVVVAVLAPLGDLCESLIKRDLEVKDLGGLLPGHGGVLDRFDAMLFALPAVYYLIKLLDVV